MPQPASSLDAVDVGAIVTALVERYRDRLLEWAPNTRELMVAPLDRTPLPPLRAELVGSRVDVHVEIDGRTDVASGHFSAPDLLCGAVLARVLGPKLPWTPRAWAPRLGQPALCDAANLARAANALLAAGEEAEALACAERVRHASEYAEPPGPRSILHAALAKPLRVPEFKAKLPKQTTHSGAAKRIVAGLADTSPHVRAEAARLLEDVLTDAAYNLLKLVPTVLSPLVAAASDDYPFVRERALSALHGFGTRLGCRRAYAETRACLDPVAEAGVDPNAVLLLRWEALLALGERELAARDRAWLRAELYPDGVHFVGPHYHDLDEAVGMGLIRAARQRLGVAFGQDTCEEKRKIPLRPIEDARARRAAIDDAASYVAEAAPIILPRLEGTLDGLPELVRAEIATYPAASRAILAKGAYWRAPRGHLRHRVEVLDVQAAVLEAQGDRAGALATYRRAQEAYLAFNPFLDQPHREAIERLSR